LAKRRSKTKIKAIATLITPLANKKLKNRKNTEIEKNNILAISSSIAIFKKAVTKKTVRHIKEYKNTTFFLKFWIGFS